jgi:hypothetical protein
MHYTIIMKQISLYIFFFISILSCFSQNKKEPFPFDEFAVSCNRTAIRTDNYMEDRYGYGLAAYITGFKTYLVNFKTGIEFNRTNQFHVSGPYLSHFNFAHDVTYHINSFSIPLNVRINLGKKIKFFLETGISPELTGGNVTGTLMIETYTTDSLGHTIITIREDRLNKGIALKFFNLGLSGGAGIAIPLNQKYDLILKSDYHFGLRNLEQSSGTIFNRYFRVVVGLKINYFKEEQKPE